MRTLTCALFGILALGAAGCGGTSSGGGPASTVTGQAGGQAVPTTDTVAVNVTQTLSTSTGSVTETSLEVAILNVANTCGILQRHGLPASTTALSFGVTTRAASIPAGTYSIGQTGAFQTVAAFGTTDASCQTKTNETATSGTVILTSVSATTVAGSFDVKMDNGDHLTGTFDAPVCNFTPLPPNSPQPVCGS